MNKSEQANTATIGSWNCVPIAERHNDHITRRQLLKRGGAATVATLIAWHSSQQQASANLPQSGASDEVGMIVIKRCVRLLPDRQQVDMPNSEHPPSNGWEAWLLDLTKDLGLLGIRAEDLGVTKAYDDGGWEDAPAGTFEYSNFGNAPTFIWDAGVKVLTAGTKICLIYKVRSS